MTAPGGQTSREALMDAMVFHAAHLATLRTHGSSCRGVSRGVEGCRGVSRGVERQRVPPLAPPANLPGGGYDSSIMARAEENGTGFDFTISVHSRAASSLTIPPPLRCKGGGGGKKNAWTEYRRVCCSPPTAAQRKPSPPSRGERVASSGLRVASRMESVAGIGKGDGIRFAPISMRRCGPRPRPGAI